jgi:hypothetical protein
LQRQARSLDSDLCLMPHALCLCHVMPCSPPALAPRPLTSYSGASQQRQPQRPAPKQVRIVHTCIGRAGCMRPATCQKATMDAFAYTVQASCRRCDQYGPFIPICTSGLFPSATAASGCHPSLSWRSTRRRRGAEAGATLEKNAGQVNADACATLVVYFPTMSHTCMG